MKNLFSLFALITVLIYFAGCKDDDPGTGRINFTFEERVDNSPLIVDSMVYTNEAGNEYLVSEVQYFISNLKLFYHDGTIYKISQDDGIHYRDTDLPDTKRWEINDEVPVGMIDSVVFTFGLDEATNVTGRFPNPPEANMFWPDQLGGGYHYMKLNGKWLDVNEMISPFNFHLGIGQTYDTTGTVTGFIQNYFTVGVKLPVYSSYIIYIDKNKTIELALCMNIESWFKTPHTWDFDHTGGMMMQNQDLLKAACENGYDVFTIEPVYEDK